MKRFLPLALLLLIVAAVFAGGAFRDQMDIDYAPKSLQMYFLGLGPIAPLFFVSVVTFRSFLLLPSMLVLTVGGLVFGALLGTALGGLGITISGMWMFGAARGIGRGLVERHVGDRFGGLQRQLETKGPLLVAIATAHPMGPMSPLHWAAGVSSIRVERFLIAIALAGLARAGACSFFGSTLFDVGSTDFYVATAALLAAIVLPLLHPGIRARILSARAAATPNSKP
jgi:uncharacterized membrane protein YdjX (TVP38/TMEM64 family)